MPTYRETAAGDFIFERASELIYQGILDEDVLDRFEVLAAHARLARAYGRYFRELSEHSRLRERKRANKYSINKKEPAEGAR